MQPRLIKSIPRLHRTLECSEALRLQADGTVDLRLKQTLLKASCDLLDASLQSHQRRDRLEQRPA